ncbi:MAG: tetratricopeptide repeat protein [Paracoccaceae bacterium]|nr:tetratricopeptide repeat protein [Paracoccaceae bacterium]
MTPIRFLPALLALGALVFLSACDTVEERAEKHYQSGAELIAESYRQYTRIVEDNADNLPARLALAEMAISARNWPEVERHGAVLIQDGADLPGADLVELTLRFREALQNEDAGLISEVTQEAVALTATYPDAITLRQIAIEGLSLEGDLRGTEIQIDEAIRLEPDDQRLYQMKAAILAEFNEADELESLLRDMVSRFPEDADLKVSLVRLLVRQGDTEAAEAFLREQIEETDASNDDFVTLVAFIRQARGNEAALVELDRLIPSVASARAGFLSALKSAILFETGRRDEGIALLQSVIDGAEESEEADRYRVSLAKMLLAAGNEVGARQLVGEVLERDTSNVDAIKMNANWLIESDQAEEAIAQLRRALDQEPQDAETMTLMSDAHRRLGDVELARDLLSLAVEASNNAPEESLRFAGVLIADGNLRPAEDVLLNALRATPGDRALLTALGSVYLDMEDWPRAASVEGTLRRDETDESTRVADRLRLQILNRQAGSGQAIAFLESLAEQEESANFARLGILQARLQAGDTDGALEIAEDLVAEFPESANARLILGNTQLAARRYESAEATFQQVVDTDPKAEQA